MRILHVASEFPPWKIYGLGRFVHDLARAQARTGHEVCVLTNSMSGRQQTARVHGIQVHRINFPSPPCPPDSATQVVLFQFALIERYAQVAPQIGMPEVVVGHDWLTALAGREIARIAGCRFVLTIHDTVVGKKFGQLDEEDRFVAEVEAFGCHDADAVIAVSGFVAAELVRDYGVAREKIHAIPGAVAPEWFSSVPRDRVLLLRTALAEPEEALVTYVGRLDREKGVDVLLIAMQRVLTALPRARLAVAGAGGQEAGLRELTEKLGIASRVRFLGYVAGEALEALYKASNVLAAPSLYEPFGIVPLEGMICGVPVVASAVGGMAEIVEHGRSGLQVPPRDPDALARAIVAILAEPEKARALSAGGRDRALRVYHWDRIAKLSEPVYRGSPETRAPAILTAGPRLVAGIRVKNGERFIPMTLPPLERIADEIHILDDGSTDRTVDMLRSFPKVRSIHAVRKTWYHEGVERGWLLEELKQTGAKWLALMDIDEVFEPRIEREIDGMLSRDDVDMYAFLFRHFWRSLTHFRVDGKWGRENATWWIPRIVRNSPGLHYPTDKALGTAQVRGFGERWVRSDIRVKHFGHLFPDLSAWKAELYSSLDRDGDYSHMVDESNLQLEEWRDA